MEVADGLIVAMRWLHSAAAIVWIGAAIFELFVLLPLFNGSPPEGVRDTVDGAMREIVQTSLVVFLVSGAILTFERLSRGAAGTVYVSLLGLKIVLAIAMYQVAFRFRRASGRRRVLGLRWVSSLGLVIVLLAAGLKWIYERALLP